MPPRAAVWMLRMILNRRNRDFIVDDLVEEFRVRVQSGSREKARFWFWGQAVRCLGPFLRAAFLGVFVRPLRAARDLATDIRYSIRSLEKSVGFTIVAVLTLALGIGANTAVFTVFSGVLLSPLPYPDQDRLVTLWSSRPDDSRRFLPSYPDYRSWRESSSSFDGMAFVYGDGMVLRTDDGLHPMLAAYVTGDFFSILRGKTERGTPFGLSGDEPDDTENVVVLKYRVWQGRFGGDPDIIGKTLSFSDGSYVVAAVMARGVDYPGWADMWTPLTRAVVDRSGLTARDRRVDTRVLAKLRQGVTRDEALAELTTIASRLAAEFPETNSDWTAGILPLETVVLDPWGNNQNLHRALYVLMAAVGFVLLIACANLANLMLARGISRERELAVRRALGAGRMRLVRQTLTESVVLAVLGAAAGVVFAHWGVEALMAGAPPLPRVDEIAVDPGVLQYTAGLTILTALMFGTAPALRNSGHDLAGVLRSGGRGSLGRMGARRLQVSLVVSQVGLALVLMIGAGLLGRSLHQLGKVDPGFRAERLLSVRILTPLPKYEDARSRSDLYRRLVDAVANVPGVESASLANHTPGGGLIFSPLRVEGLQDEATTAFKTVAPGYFETMEIALIEGRSFDRLDMTEGTDALIINQSLSDIMDVGLGRRITVYKQVADDELGEPVSGQVVGIVGDTRVSLSQANPYPNVFVPYTVNPWMHVEIVARSSGEFAGVGEHIRQAVLSVEPEIPGVEPAFMANRMSRTVSRERFAARLMGTFAAAALLLCSVGIYGVMAYLVRQRTAEIGLRMAMGATATNVIRLVVGRAMSMVVLGATSGLVAAVGLMRFLQALLFGVGSIDPVTYILVTAVVVLVALGASFLPASHATRIEPLSALRGD